MTSMIDNQFLHNIAMERQARQSQMQNMVISNIVVRTDETQNCEVDCDYHDYESGYETDNLGGASDDELGDDGNIHPDHEDSVLSQSSARDKLEWLMDFAEGAGLDKPSARTALSTSMGDEDR